MGCGGSTTRASMPPNQVYPSQPKPVAPVQPQMQPYQQPPMQQPVPQPVKQPPYQQPPYQQPPVQQPPVQQPPQQPVPVQQPPAAPQEDDDIGEVPQVTIDENLLQRFIEIDREIAELETIVSVQKLEAKKSQVADLEKTVQQLQEEYKILEQQTAKEKKDVVDLQKMTVKEYFANEEAFDKQLSKEQEEYVDALNKQEIGKQKLEASTKQLEQLKADITSFSSKNERYQQLQAEEDILLAGVFKGRYGSELEYKLEEEVDMLHDRKQRVLTAKFKWHNARVLMHHAVSQLALGVRRWLDLKRVPVTYTQQSGGYIIHTSNTRLRYQMAAEARNNFVAASQNISGAQKYLNTITFPYCTPQEVNTLNSAINHIFTDMQAGEQRYQHAYSCYNTTHRRAAALIQWFDMVIKNTIMKDLDDVAKLSAQKKQDLRKERLRLLKLRVQEVLGREIKSPEVPDVVPDLSLLPGDDDDFESELALLFEPEGQEEKEQDLEKEIKEAQDKEKEIKEAEEKDKPKDEGEEKPEGEGGLKVPEGPAEVSPPTPLPLNELAPPPQQQDLFGDIEFIKQQHEKNVQEYERSQEINRARMQQGLEEKLRARRKRRERLQAQQQEMANMQVNVASA
ncbi:FK506-binding protein 5-like isoform X1 [Branchiostoma lanceolatum]|uniref:FK506-binding protein 5-like isoform X1 n=1 Tax=Branchiostoma lanceolatum TaxID=7740 RepID=UPI003452A489